MAYSNPTSWDIDGVSLQTLANNIETTTGLAPPPLRGDDIVIPYRAGAIWQPKTPDVRIIPFQAWVRGSNPDGSDPNGKSKREKFFDNWHALRALIWRFGGEEFTLVKRFPYNNGIKVVYGKASFDSGLEPSMHGPHAAKFTFNLKMTDPFFYDGAYTQFNLNNGNNTVNLDGQVPTRNVKVVVNSTRVNTLVQNNDLFMGVRYGTTVGSGSASIDAYTYDSNLNGTRSNGAVTHFGSPDWLRLKPGSQTIGLSSDSGSGLVSLFGKGAWI